MLIVEWEQQLLELHFLVSHSEVLYLFSQIKMSKLAVKIYPYDQKAKTNQRAKRNRNSDDQRVQVVLIANKICRKPSRIVIKM